MTDSGILIELVCSDIIVRQKDLNVLLLRGVQDFLDLLCSCVVEDGISDLFSIDDVREIPLFRPSF
jgi:hypothetical protein